MAEKVDLQPTEQRCAYYLPAKKRRCKMLVARGSDYCGQHSNTLVSKLSHVFVMMITEPFVLNSQYHSYHVYHFNFREWII